MARRGAAATAQPVDMVGMLGGPCPVERQEGAGALACRIGGARQGLLDQRPRRNAVLGQPAGQVLEHAHCWISRKAHELIASFTASASCFRVKGLGRKAKSVCPSRFFSKASSA